MNSASAKFKILFDTLMEQEPFNVLGTLDIVGAAIDSPIMDKDSFNKLKPFMFSRDESVHKDVVKLLTHCLLKHKAEKG